ncbi:hypothetical protein AB0M44_11515 [Streptosporangium subroseum]|uniref:STAS domain-containing protein n=2 Tax=Streptosporangiaceae TaxID=2004 RepID=A0A239BMP2_9ACTN|nr:hypothetical protein DKM19_13240 [Streptosporangium sp. 'caverna']SNS09457.1 hypothetical protein SAMN05216276_100433 [Streptosporangium subroseum]
MTFRWHHEVRSDVEILRFSGHVGLMATDLVATTVGLAPPRTNRPLVLDLTDMEGWGPDGRAAVVDAVRSLAVHRRVAVCQPRDKLTSWAISHDDPSALMYPDLRAALATLHSSADVESGS